MINLARSLGVLGFVLLALNPPTATASGIECGGSFGPFDDSGHVISTTGCYANATQAGRAARANLDAVIKSSNGFSCNNFDCAPATCVFYVTYHEAGQPAITTFESPAGCWQGIASYTSGKITVGCSACTPI